MFRNCVKVLNSVSKNLNQGSKYALIKRHAGHSKWQNIKHTKAANDAAKAAVITQFIQRMQVAIKDGGPNPELNTTLRNIIEEAKRKSIPKDTLEKVIKRASGEGGKPVTYIVRGPKNLMFTIETFTAAAVRTKNQIQAICKKFNFAVDVAHGHEDEFKLLGIVKCSPLKGEKDSLDKALEHALEVDAEEVTEDEEKNLVFQCHTNRVEQIRQRLQALGYSINFADVVTEFSFKCKINDSETEVMEKFTKKLEEISEVVKISDNIE